MRRFSSGVCGTCWPSVGITCTSASADSSLIEHLGQRPGARVHPRDVRRQQQHALRASADPRAAPRRPFAASALPAAARRSRRPFQRSRASRETHEGESRDCTTRYIYCATTACRLGLPFRATSTSVRTNWPLAPASHQGLGLSRNAGAGDVDVGPRLVGRRTAPGTWPP